MHCVACAERPVFEHLCKEHFLRQFEARVTETIKEYALFTKRDRIVVAASGGKDSTSLLFLLKKLDYLVEALAIDEGIAGYRDKSLDELRAFCKEHAIPLRVVSFKEAFGRELDEIMQEAWHPCTVCGTFRRFLMNKYAKGYDVIATGHNADDEAQTVLMNLTRANTDLFPRGGPVTRSAGKGFVKRVKPFYFCSEKEILTYALLLGFANTWNECPYASQAYRATVREALNTYEAAHPGAKRRILHHYLAVKPSVTPSHTLPCTRCGEPSQGGLCKACRLLEELA